MIWTCDDGNGPVEIDAETAEEAAEAYVDGGDWGDFEKSFFLDIQCESDDGDEETVTVTVDPEPPSCPGGEHDWCRPVALVGGLKENPGVFGHGGGVIFKDVCSHCGVYRVTDTWAQHNGVQGLTSVSFEDSDEESLEWVGGG